MLAELRELSKIFRLTSGSAKDFFISPDCNGGKREQFLQILLDESSVTEESLFKRLYSNPNQEKAYMMLRKGVISKLLNNLYLLQPKKVYGSDFMVNYFNAQKGLFLTRALFTLGMYNSGLSVAKKTLVSARKIELWDIVSSISSLLSDLYSSRGDKKNFELYDRLSITSLDNLYNERRVKRFVNKWNIYFKKVAKASNRVLSDIEYDLNKVAEIERSSPTSINRHYHYRMKLLYHDAKMDYKSAIKTCDEAIEFLKNEPNFNVPARQGIYMWSKMYCYLNLRDFESAQEFTKMGEQYFVPGTMNWFTVMEYYYVLSIQTKNYEVAYDLIGEVISGAGYKGLPEASRQKWMILEAYMALIIDTRIWKNAPGKDATNKFRVSRFLNEVDVFRKDKEGTYVSILILQILFLIQYGRFSEVIEKREALSRYIRRYLYTRENERSRVFLTMLQRVIDSDFSYAKTEERSRRLLSVLRTKQMNYTANIGGNEIVDYEILWDWLLNRLKENPVGVAS